MTELRPTFLEAGRKSRKFDFDRSIWFPTFDEFRLGDTPQIVVGNLPFPIPCNWLDLPQAFEYRHDLVKYFYIGLTDLGESIEKFLPPGTSFAEGSYLCFLFVHRKLFHLSLRLYHDENHQNYNRVVELYARRLNISTVEHQNRQEFFDDDDDLMIYYSCFHPERSYTCLAFIEKKQTVSTDGHWFSHPTREHQTIRERETLPGREPISSRYDIMISYCHKDKEICHLIYEHLLESHFRIWIDLENLYGPVISRMAEAIENSDIVLICMSNSYKSSNYCQLEAEYAFKYQTIFIPLTVSKDFQLDGWLGMLCGLKFRIDFTKTSFSVAFEKLLSEIFHQLNKKSNSNRIEEKRVQTNDSVSCSRLEIDVFDGHKFLLTEEECQNGFFSLSYDFSADRYSRNGVEQNSIFRWIDWIFSCSNVRREKSCFSPIRKDLVDGTNSICWRVDFDELLAERFRFNRILVEFCSNIFESSVLPRWKIRFERENLVDLTKKDENDRIQSFEYRFDFEQTVESIRRVELIVFLDKIDDWNEQKIRENSEERFLKIKIDLVDRDIFRF